jgi:acyl carrier protein
MNPDIRVALREFIVREFKPPVVPGFDSPLLEQGIIDSLAIFMLIGFIDEHYGVHIDSEDVSIENFETINAIERLVAGARRG